MGLVMRVGGGRGSLFDGVVNYHLVIKSIRTLPRLSLSATGYT